MINYEEFKRAFSQLDVAELLSGDGLSQTDQELLFEELKKRVLAKLDAYVLTDEAKKAALFELLRIELQKRHANTVELQMLTDTEQRIISMLEKRTTLKKNYPERITVTPYNVNLKLNKYL